LLRGVIEEIKQDPKLTLQVIVTGQHLSQKHGYTLNEIIQDGYQINSAVDMLVSSDTKIGVTKSIGLGLISFSETFDNLKPDMIVILGDRYEMLCPAIAAMIANIPIAHIHGGEATEGLIDEAIRHSITKMSHLHFVAAEEYRMRVIQLGEQPNTIFTVGGLGVDALKRLKLYRKNEIEAELGFTFDQRNLMISYHPVTLDLERSLKELKELLAALIKLHHTKLIFTMPNSDPGGNEAFNLIDKFCDENSNAIFFKSLGQLRFLSCMKFCDALVGNSSSGLLEAPSLKIATVNIGDRQKGRLKAPSVIDCKPTTASIYAAINSVYNKNFQDRITHSQSPYGNGGASKKIVKILSQYPFEKILHKPFYNLNLK
jgi:GDP/UDP-N,N'-diacetylbacillosamine 2-epimerase (hydrolysing)